MPQNLSKINCEICIFDRSVSLWVQGIGYTPCWWRWINRISALGSETVIYILLLILILCYIKSKHFPGATLIVGTGTASLMYRILKLAVHRPRPLGRLVEATGYSYPSGHALMATVFYGLLIWTVWKSGMNRRCKMVLSVLLACIIIAIGLSRVYLNVHYPSDVVAGMACGIFWLGMASYFNRAKEK
jgi:undecaprenyl-diphosphatase